MKRSTYKITVAFKVDQAGKHQLMSRVRDFGEAIFYDLRNEKRYVFDLNVIDAAWDQFYFTATSELLARRAQERVYEMLPAANLFAEVTVTEA